MFIKKLIKKRSFFLVGCFMLVLVNLQGMNIELLRGTHTVFPQEAKLGHCSPAFGLLLWELGVIKLLYLFAAKNLNKIGKEAEEIKAVPVVGPGEGELEEKGVPAGRGQGVPEEKHVAPEEKGIFPLSSADWETTQPGDSATERLIQELFHMVMGGLNVSHIEKNIARYIPPEVLGEILGTVERYKDNSQEIEQRLGNLLSAENGDRGLNELQRYLNMLDRQKTSKKLASEKELEELKEQKDGIDEKLVTLFNDLKILKEANAQENPQRTKKIKEVSDLSQRIKTIKKSQKNPELEKELRKALEKELGTLERDKEAIQESLIALSKETETQEDSQEIKNKKQEKMNKQQEQEEIKTKMAEIHRSMGDIDETIKYITRNISVSANRVVQYIIRSLHECNFFGNNLNPLFPPYTTHAILLAFMIRKASTQADLQRYCDGFNEGYGSPIATFTHEAYTDQDLEGIRTTIQGDLASLFTDNQRFGDLVCSELIKRATTGLPGATGHRTIPYNGISFADCVETVIRILCNFMAYDLGSKSFQPPATASKAIKDFYVASSKNRDVHEIANPIVHTAWAPVVSNQEGILYNRMKIAGQQTSVHAQGCGYSGFVRGITPPEGSTRVSLQVGGNTVNAYEATLPNGLKIAIIDELEDQYELYEMRPSVRNIIIQLNRLYNLNLYPNLAKVYFNANFNQIYFSALYEKLGWMKVSGADNLDNNDLKNYMLITIAALGEQFTIHLSPGHGYVTVAHAAAVGEGWKARVVEQAIQILTTADSDPHAKMRAWYLIGLYGNLENIWNLYATNPMYARNALYGGTYLTAESQRIQVVKNIIDHNRSELYTFANRLIPTFSIQIDLLHPIEILYKYVLKIEKLESLQGGIVAMLKQIAKSGFFSIGYFDSLENLVETNKHFDEATEAARNGMSSQYSHYQIYALQLFKILVEKGHGINEATQAAESGMASDDPGIQETASELSDTLRTIQERGARE